MEEKLLKMEVLRIDFANFIESFQQKHGLTDEAMEYILVSAVMKSREFALIASLGVNPNV